jgi:hypothetical protein
MAQENPPQGNQGEKKPQEIKVTVDAEQLKMAIEAQKRAEDERKKLQDQLDALEAKRKLEAEELVKIKEKAEEDREKLELITQADFEKKRNTLLEKAKALIQDPERVKDIEKKLSNPDLTPEQAVDQLQATEYMISVLDDAMKKGEEAHKKLLDEEKKKADDLEKKLKEGGGAGQPAGSAPLSTGQITGGTPQVGGYDSYEAMIRDLRKKEHSPNPEVAAMAKNALTELFRKWAMSVKKEYREMREFTSEPKKEEMLPLSEITKHQRAKDQDARKEAGLPVEEEQRK